MLEAGSKVDTEGLNERNPFLAEEFKPTFSRRYPKAFFSPHRRRGCPRATYLHV